MWRESRVLVLISLKKESTNKSREELLIPKGWSISSDVGYYHSRTSEDHDGDTSLNEFFGNTGHVYTHTSHRNNKK